MVQELATSGTACFYTDEGPDLGRSGGPGFPNKGGVNRTVSGLPGDVSHSKQLASWRESWCLIAMETRNALDI